MRISACDGHGCSTIPHPPQRVSEGEHGHVIDKRFLCMEGAEKKNRRAPSVETIGSRMFEALARTFPVSCASDEFFYFPQVQLPEPRWSTWDCFSSESVEDFVRQLSTWENELELLKTNPSEMATQMDIALLQSLACILREQLFEVRSWESQPTFYLTLVCMGLAEAIGMEDPAAGHERAKGLPAFLDQAGRNLDRVPLLFRDLGLEMVSSTREYLLLLKRTLPELDDALIALDRFEQTLRSVSTQNGFSLPRDLLERVYRSHIHCDMDIEEVNFMLDQELDTMRHILDEETRRFLPNRFADRSSDPLWLEAVKKIPVPVTTKDELVGLYREEITRLARHCLDQKLVSPDQVSFNPVRVVPMPPYLYPIRTASSYTISPKHPPSGGTFYVIETFGTEEVCQSRHREYRMLAAHETYPGHHLLDISRWNLARYCRRVIEKPIFYEGWACFSEELMKLTGYFSDPDDRLLLAKRRYWRAIRGKVDIGLQTGTMDIPTAVGWLKKTGISTEQALSSARKYPLNPGYQVCYTVGLHRFLDLLDRYGQCRLPPFVRTVLNEGEIAFEDLEKIMNQLDEK